MGARDHLCIGQKDPLRLLSIILKLFPSRQLLIFAARVGRIFGTVVRAGPDPSFPYRGCDVHGWDIEGHSEVTGGLADVIVTAEPLDPTVRSSFRDDAPLDKDDAELTWREDLPERVMVARPKGSLTIDNLEDHHVRLAVSVDSMRLATPSRGLQLRRKPRREGGPAPVRLLVVTIR